MAGIFNAFFGSCCGGLGSESPTVPRRKGQTHQNSRAVDSDEVRRNAAAAAEARMKSEDKRGLQTTTEFQRMKERQAKIDKAQEEYERKGGDAALGSGLKWQMG